MTERFDQVRVGVEDLFHSDMPDLEDYSLFECHNICCARFTSEQRHLAKECAFAERGYGARAAVFV